ncbi:MAG: sulfur carrier protein ThiS [Vicinamibacterales bacterium]
MTILLNGDRHDLAAPLTVLALLRSLDVDPRMVAVELNRAVVRRDRYADTTVDDGAEVEIVAFVGGGAPRALASQSRVRWLAGQRRFRLLAGRRPLR